MRLTKLQRHTAYILMLAEVKNIGKDGSLARFGFCYMILCLFNITDYFKPFPELERKKPNTICEVDGNPYWFERGTKTGWEKRIEILEQCISETY